MTLDNARDRIAKIRGADARGQHAEAYRESMALLEEIKKLIERATRKPVKRKARAS